MFQNLIIQRCFNHRIDPMKMVIGRYSSSSSLRTIPSLSSFSSYSSLSSLSSFPTLLSTLPNKRNVSLQYRYHGGGHHHEFPTPSKSGDDTIQLNNAKSQSITRIGLWVNLLLSGGKGAIGMLCHSPSLLADAMHSATDLISDFITLVTLKKASLPISSKHPYGQGKYEALGALSCSALLLGSAGGLVWHSGEILLNQLSQSASTLSSHHHDALLSPDSSLPLHWALSAAFLSIIAKEILFRYTLDIGQKTHSQVVIANAWHHRSDSLSSIVVCIGIGASVLFDITSMDSIAGLIVAGMIGKAGYEIGRDSLTSLTDGNVDVDIIQSLRASIATVPDVRGFHKLRARRSGPTLFVDLHIEVDAHLSITATHQICHQVETAICRDNDRVAEVIVHADPIEKEGDFSTASRLLDLQQQYVSRPESAMPDSNSGSPQSWWQEPPSSPDHYPVMHHSIEDIEHRCVSIIQAEFSSIVKGVSLFTVHYVAGKLIVELAIVPTTEQITIAEIRSLSIELKKRLSENITDVQHFQLYLDLTLMKYEL